MTKSTYIAEHNSSAKLECKFPIDKDYGIQNLKIFWHKIVNSSLELEVFMFFNGSEDLQKQDVNYRGRAHLLEYLLQSGKAVLEINPVKVTDAGVYRCLIELGGADYKQGTLQVKASYKNVQKHVRMIGSVNGKQQLEISCKSTGFPKAEVLWNNGTHDLSDQANTTSKNGTEQLYSITSFMRVIPHPNDTYFCIFMNNNLRESMCNFTYLDWQILKGVDAVKPIYVGAAITVIVLLMLLVCILFLWKKRKGLSLLHNEIFQEKKKHPCGYCSKSNCTECWTSFGDLFRSSSHVVSHTGLKPEESNTTSQHRHHHTHHQEKQQEASQLHKLLVEDSQTGVSVEGSQTTVSIHYENES